MNVIGSLEQVGLLQGPESSPKSDGYRGPWTEAHLTAPWHVHTQTVDVSQKTLELVKLGLSPNSPICRVPLGMSLTF